MNGYETKELQQDQIAALIRERDEYLAVGNKEAAEACEESLRAFGHKVEAPAKTATRRSTRRSRPKPKDTAPTPKPGSTTGKKKD